MPSGQQIALWRTVDPDFDKYYDATPYGERALFLSVYKEVFKWFYGYGRMQRRVVITESLPDKYREKYFLKPGDEFESFADLEKHCKSRALGRWIGHGWVEFIENEKLQKPEIQMDKMKPRERGIHVIVSWTMPKKLCDKYKIKPGDKFGSLTELRKHCGCSVCPPSYWLKKQWITPQQ